MPDKDGRLSAEERKTTTDWINARWKVRTPCPICGVHDWKLGEFLVTTPIYSSEPFAPNVPAFPHVSVGCGNCGYTLLFSAVTVGLLNAFVPIQPAPNFSSILRPQPKV